MSKRQFKSQASSGRLGGGFGGFGATGLGSTQSSILSYIQEPPDYASVSDPQAVVAFKNLSKKDATTKAKALEDLSSYVTSLQGEPEDGLLDTWVKIFPRLSIDNARRVRLLSHVLNGQICSRCGKRAAKYLPRIAGPWLAGTYDNDRACAKAAQDALGTVFNSAEKVTSLRKTFQRSILEYCRDASLHETVQTLSDERVVSTEDAQGTYARVVATSLTVIGSLLASFPEDASTKNQQVYEGILGESTFWDFVCHADPGVRRSTHRLVQTCLLQQPTLIENELKLASTSYVYKGLPSDQSGCAVDYMQTLVALTIKFSTVWTDDYSGKKPAASRLRQCLKHGSQSGSGSFWDALFGLIDLLPSQVLPSTYDEAVDLVSAAKGGVMKKDERFNAASAWTAYFRLVQKVASSLSEEDSTKLLATFVMPIIQQYLHPSSDTAEWGITSGKPATLAALAARTDNMVLLLQSELPREADKLIETAKMSQPEQSKEFDKSQLYVAAAGERWADFQREVFLEDEEPVSFTNAISEANRKVISECVELLKSRNGKPYGAAAIIESLLRARGDTLLIDGQMKDIITSFCEEQIPRLIMSASRRQLIHSLFALKEQSFFPTAFGKAIDTILASTDDLTAKIQALRTIFPVTTPSEGIEVAKTNTELQGFVESGIESASSQETILLLSDLLKLGAVAPETTDATLSHLTASLSITEQADAGLSGLELLSNTNESTVRAWMAKPGASSEQLLPSVLRLEQSTNDATAEKATALSTKLSSAMSEANHDTKFSAVLQNLNTVSTRSLPIDALCDLTDRLLGQSRQIQDTKDILPSMDAWATALQAAIMPPLPSLAILSALGGSVHLVDSAQRHTSPVQWDAEGLSQALRIAIYVARLLSDSDLALKLEEDGELESSLHARLYIATLVVEDNMSILGCNAMWDPHAVTELESVALDFITEANTVLGKVWSRTTPTIYTVSSSNMSEHSQYSRFMDSVQSLSQAESRASPLSYYTSLAAAKINANLFELYGHNSEQTKASESTIRKDRSDKDVLATATSIVGLQQPLSGAQTITRYCNELVADLTDLDISSAEGERKAMQQLVLLNLILQTQEDVMATIATQRLVFLVKRLIPALNTGTTLAITAEICKALSLLLPGIADMYGEHWSQTLSYLIGFWTSITLGAESSIPGEGQILVMHATLRLYIALQKLSKAEEPNDDLVDALKDNQDQIKGSLMQLLKAAKGAPDAIHQPLMLTHDLIARSVSQLPYKELPDADELYPLLYTPSQSIQHAAFSLLHKHIPASQEQISFDAALEKKTASLPDELLSLILEAPTLDSLADASFQRTMPLPLQGYLYSWRLLFDHFDGSSYKVKSDYIEQLKDGTYLNGLLNLTFDFLGHTRGKPVDASKFDIQEYVADSEPSPERDVQWLLTHLYYLALTHLPSLVKSYYLDIRSRQTSLAVESWTGKYISPLIVNVSLQAVAEWSEKSVKEDPEYEKMGVKVSMKSKEINVSYVVDEQTMAIKVVLPEAYPLAPAQVMGVSRVAVKEEKWQSWLRNCQGVITFSNGSITDGLSAWRKNVTGALSGASECSICYSIIDSQKSLPTKRCPTCKHLFHSSCLFKWFKTSNASTCPLCRNAFNFN